MKLIELYKSILSVAGLVADKEGMVSAVIEDTSMPFTVKGKRLVLPLKEQLKNGDWDHRCVFHPLSENILRPGESEVMTRFRQAMNTRLNYVLGCLIEDLMVIATSPKLHKKMDPDQAELLTALKDADEKSLTNLQTMLKAAQDANKNKGLVHIFLKKNGIVHSKKYSRAGIVNFPMYDSIVAGDKNVNGVVLRKKDVDTFKALFEFIFPQINVANAFDRGSSDDVAPFLDALMKAVAGVASCINTTVEGFEKFLPKAESYMFNYDWVDSFDNLASLLPEIRMIPMQSGNDGSLPKQIQEPIQNVTSSPQTVMSPIQQPTVNTTGVVHTENGIDFAASMRSRGMHQPMPPQPYGNQFQQPYGYPQQPMQQRGPSWAMPQQPMSPQPYGYQPPQQYPYPQQPMQQQQYGTPYSVNNNGFVPGSI